MKPSHKSESIKSAPTHYSPSVPMSVYRELAAELRANKAVIDSLNSRNQQLIQQNQRLKKEIHNVVQATLNLGQFAGVARPAGQAELRQEFPSAIAPDTLAKLVRAQGEAIKAVPSESDSGFNPHQDYMAQDFPDHTAPEQAAKERTAKERTTKDYTTKNSVEMPAAVSPLPQATPSPRRKPRPIQKAAAQVKSPDRAPAPRKPAAKAPAKAVPPKPQAKAPGRAVNKAAASKTANSKTTNRVAASSRPPQREAIAVQPKPLPKLFTEQTGEYRHSSLSSEEEKEIGGIWLALSIILIIVTAFGAGFLIMKPLLNDR